MLNQRCERMKLYLFFTRRSCSTTEPYWNKCEGGGESRIVESTRYLDDVVYEVKE